MNRRAGFLLVIAGVLVACWYVARFEGDPKPVDPLLVAPLHEAPAWQSQPTLLQNIDEPAAIYVVFGLPGDDGLFEAVRLDANSGARSTARIRFGPNTSYLPFDSAEVVGIPAIELHGLTHRRPTFHLFTFPGPGGPGFHFVDSATGVLHVVAGTGSGRRTLLTLTLINSSSLPEIRSLLWSDRSRRFAAFLWREADIWKLYLFSLIPAQTPSLIPARTPFEFLGKFSNMNYSQDHQYGEDVYLWRGQDALHGYMDYSLGGALGDYTTARLENVRFDAAAKTLSFQARNPLYDEKGNVIRNLFLFDGLIGPNAIEGALKCRSVLTDEHCSNDRKVSWKKTPVDNPETYRMASRQDWETHVSEQLKEHGAKW
jgi:hypothetical protein